MSDPKQTLNGLYRLMQDHREDADDGHKRLRTDIRILEKRMDSQDSERNSFLARVQHLEDRSNQPTEVSELRFTPTMVFAIVAAVASIIGGSYAVNAGQRSDIRDIGTKLESQTKLNDERLLALKAAVDAVERREQLQQYEMQQLKESIQKRGKQ